MDNIKDGFLFIPKVLGFDGLVVDVVSFLQLTFGSLIFMSILVVVFCYAFTIIQEWFRA